MFKKLIISALVYLLIGGTINGFALATRAEKCGEKVGAIDGYAQSALLWPSLMATAFVLAVKDTEMDSTCKTAK